MPTPAKPLGEAVGSKTPAYDIRHGVPALGNTTPRHRVVENDRPIAKLGRREVSPVTLDEDVIEY